MFAKLPAAWTQSSFVFLQLQQSAAIRTGFLPSQTAYRMHAAAQMQADCLHAIRKRDAMLTFMAVQVSSMGLERSTLCW